MAPPKKPNTAVLAMQKKWQEAAVQMGGEGAKIIVSKAEAKPLIFASLLEMYRPMSITAIYKLLKAAVPSPVLKACLDEMTVDCRLSERDDDCEDDITSINESKGKSDVEDKFGGSICVKPGRNISGTLYYINQGKLDNGGNGLRPDDRNALTANSRKALEERDSLANQLKSINSDTSKLLSEPMNDVAFLAITRDEKQMACLEEKLKESRQLLVNEKTRQLFRKRVQSMADHWWKRRRLCMDFLCMIEECTEGTMSVKKCLAGNGQIDIESDEVIIENAIEAHKNRTASQHLRRKPKKQRASNGVEPTTTFVGMKMNGKGYLSRVHVEEND